MPSTYLLARDHLEQAATILTGEDDHSIQLRNILVRTIALMRDYEEATRVRNGVNVVRFDDYFTSRR